MNDKHPSSAQIFIALIPAVIGACLVLAFITLPLIWEPYSRVYAVQHAYSFQKIPFESQQWKLAKSFDKSKWLHLQMVDSLLQEYRLVGMNQRELESLLGKSDPSYRKSNGSQYVYWISPSHNFVDLLLPPISDLHFDWLCLKLKDGVVVEAKILRD